MNIPELKKQLQNHFTDGLVTIVGSGLSIAEGIPGMSALAGRLLDTLPPQVPPPSSSQWEKIAAALSSGTDLETTLLAHQPDAALESLIVNETAQLLCPAERAVFQDVISGKKVLRFARLLHYMLKPNSGIPVITTNYDRLIELAAEYQGLGVDTLFVGRHFGRLDPKESRYSLCRRVTEKKVGGVRRAYPELCPHVRVLKPHGSLDWFHGAGGPICCSTPLSQQRLLITPGLNKYRGGYNPPFDTHRDKANGEIDKASRFLIIGYGFNDEHLQTHLETRLRTGTPTIIITRTLSEKARCLVPLCSGIVALSQRPGEAGAVITTRSGETYIPGSDIWDLGTFIKEVLQP